MEDIRARLESDLIETTWGELHAHLERGAVFEVHHPVPLIEAATAIALDQRVIVEAWLSSGHLCLLSPDSKSPDVGPINALIVQPYVCIQLQAQHPIPDTKEAPT